jgi:uncharacterized membrane protein YgdD (TMEM256/DUF423 family)
MPSLCTARVDFTRETSRTTSSMVKDVSSYQMAHTLATLLITSLKEKDHFIGTMARCMRASFWRV